MEQNRDLMKRRAWRVHWGSLAAGVLLGLVAGGALGVRYLSWNHHVIIPLSLLPPHQRNFSAEAVQQLTEGMTKSEVIARLGLEQVVVLPGKLPDASWRWVFDDADSNPDPTLGKVAEVWLAPEQQWGLSRFVTLCFDGSQQLCRIGGGDFVLGFPVKPVGYIRK